MAFFEEPSKKISDLAKLVEEIRIDKLGCFFGRKPHNQLLEIYTLISGGSL